MTLLISILAKTQTGAILEIVLMLLIAGIIAFITSYLFYKPIYQKKINALEDEKKELNQHINSLKSEITLIEEELSGLKKELEEKEKKSLKKKSGKKTNGK